MVQLRTKSLPFPLLLVIFCLEPVVLPLATSVCLALKL